jgi:hypothetical protein
MGLSHLASQGAELQEIAIPEIRPRKLAEYQAEIWACTDFLTRRYDANNH